MRENPREEPRKEMRENPKEEPRKEMGEPPREEPRQEMGKKLGRMEKSRFAAKGQKESMRSHSEPTRNESRIL